MSFYNLYKVYVYDFVLKFYHNFLNNALVNIVVASFLKPLKNKTIKLTVKNNNRLKGNPNYTSFKNDFKLL